MKLVTMQGGAPSLGAPQYQFSLFSMSGNYGAEDPIMEIDPRTLSNVDAGVQALYALAKSRPGLRWADIVPTGNLAMGNWFDRNIGSKVRGTVSWVGDVAGSVGDKLGEWGGSAIRLASDKQVMEGVSQYGAAYASGGKSAGILGMLKNLGGNKGDAGILEKFLSGLGLASKESVDTSSIDGKLDDKKLFLIAGGLILLVLLLKMGK